MTVDGFEASGTVSSSGFYAGLGRARSDAQFVLEVLETSTYSLSGEIFGSGDATTRVHLIDSNGEFLEGHVSFSFGNGGPGGPISSGGVLVPGEYTFRAFSFSCSDEMAICGRDVGNGSYAVSLVVIPEPSTATLVGVGLVILLGLSWRRRGHSA